jgi:hypothetical protein
MLTGRGPLAEAARVGWAGRHVTAAPVSPAHGVLPQSLVAQDGRYRRDLVGHRGNHLHRHRRDRTQRLFCRTARDVAITSVIAPKSPDDIHIWRRSRTALVAIITLRIGPSGACAHRREADVAPECGVAIFFTGDCETRCRDSIDRRVLAICEVG